MDKSGPASQPPCWPWTSLFLLLPLAQREGSREGLLLPISLMRRVHFLPKLNEFKGPWMVGGSGQYKMGRGVFKITKTTFSFEIFFKLERSQFPSIPSSDVALGKNDTAWMGREGNLRYLSSYCLLGSVPCECNNLSWQVLVHSFHS